MDFIIRSLILAVIMIVVFILGIEWQSVPFPSAIVGIIYIFSNIALDRYVEMKSEKKWSGINPTIIITSIVLVFIGLYFIQYFLQNQNGQTHNQQQIAQESTNDATSPLYNEQDLKPLIDAQASMIKRAWAERKHIQDENVKAYENNIDLLCKNRIVAKKYGWTIDNNLFINKDGLFFYVEDCHPKKN